MLKLRNELNFLYSTLNYNGSYELFEKPFRTEVHCFLALFHSLMYILYYKLNKEIFLKTYISEIYKTNQFYFKIITTFKISF